MVFGLIKRLVGGRPKARPPEDVRLLKGPVSLASAANSEPEGAAIPAPLDDVPDERAKAVAGQPGIVEGESADVTAETGTNVEDLMTQAATAASHGDLPTALRDWQDARLAHDAPVDAWLLAAKHLDDADAFTLLLEATTRFPKSPFALHDFARAAERRDDWSTAEQTWRAFIAIEDDKWWAFAALSASLRGQERLHEAEQILSDAQTRFPGDWPLAIDYARLAEHQNDWNTALDRWETVTSTWPERWEGAVGTAAALKHLGRDTEHAEVIKAAAERFPERLEILHDRARLAEAENDWIGAETYWRAFVAVNPTEWWASLGLAEALQQQGRLSESDILLQEACEQFPDNHWAFRKRAEVAEQRGDWAEAIRRWTRLGDQFDEPVSHRLHDLQMKILDQEIELAQKPDGDLSRLLTARPNASAPADVQSHHRDVMMRFESLGGLVTGCEFGGVQRSFGAEPLGLLRWSGMAMHTLIDLLERKFENVGEVSTTKLGRYDVGDRQEYSVKDTTFDFITHTHIFADEMEETAVFNQITKRMTFLRRKLLEDLASGEKLFVFKNSLREPSEDEAERLHEALKSYGESILLIVTSAETAHPNGALRAVKDNIWLGYVDFTGEYTDARADKWLELCINATYRFDSLRSSRKAAV